MADIGEKNYLINGVAQESSVQEVDNAVDNLSEVVAGLVTTMNTMKTTLDILATSSGGGGIKHIQRGTGLISKDTNTKSITLSGFENLDKMIAIVTGGRQPSMNGGTMYGGYAYVQDLTTSMLTVNCQGQNSAYGNYCHFGYQVIEFE